MSLHTEINFKNDSRMGLAPNAWYCAEGDGAFYDTPRALAAAVTGKKGSARSGLNFTPPSETKVRCGPAQTDFPQLRWHRGGTPWRYTEVDVSR